jgi:hypothetical protein
MAAHAFRAIQAAALQIQISLVDGLTPALQAASESFRAFGRAVGAAGGLPVDVDGC